METVLKSFVYKHPEIDDPWHTEAVDSASAKEDFEARWVDTTLKGTLAEVQGSFADGAIEEE